MRTALLAVALVLVSVLSPASASAIAPTSTPAHPTAIGPVDTIQFIAQSSAATALQQLDAGSMDVYLGTLTSMSLVQSALSDPNVNVLRGTGEQFDVFANPVPVNQTLAPGLFNPFASAEARRALSLLLDRDDMNRQIFSGLGFTHSTIWSPESPEYAREPFFFSDQNQSYSYSFARGQAMLFDALNASGAVYSGGVWTWQGNPIVVQFLVRVEDQRHQAGDYVTAVLRALGLQVNEQIITRATAFAVVYSGEPDTGAWTLYTEAFASSDIYAWSDSDLYYFACGGDGVPIWSYYSPSPELAQVCTQLLNREYTSLAQREALVERGSHLAMNESVRIWLLDNEVYAYAKRIQGLVPGFVAPPLGIFSLRSAHFSTPGGTLVAGNRIELVSPYQPWQGFSFIDDRNVEYTFSDFGLALHPYTGEYIPLRSEFQVTTAGPTGNLSVPADAVEYNTSTDAWEAVPTNTSATSLVTFDYTFGKWHHGVPIDMNDVLYAISLIARRNHGDVATHDPDAANFHDRAFASEFRGLRVLNATRLEIYINDWQVDPAFIAEAADVWPQTPWEVDELAMDTTLHDHTRVSEATAYSEGLVPLDLTAADSLGYMDREISDGNVTTGGTGVTRPPGFAGLINVSQAAARWTALRTWRNATGNYYPSNGPFMLTSTDYVGRTITVSRFVDYPIPSSRWDSLQAPQIPTLSVDPIPDVKPGATAVVNMTTLVAGLPYSNATVSYRVLPANLSQVLTAGNATLVSPGNWQAVLDSSFTSGVPLGKYELQAVAVGSNASVPVFANRSFWITTDTTPPTSSIVALLRYWETAAPVSLAVNATDDSSGVASVELYVAYSADNASWSTPALALTETTPPFPFSYMPAQGNGYYRFWTLATDGAGNSETLSSKPAAGEAQIGFDTSTPSSALTGPATYWHVSVPIALSATASDGLSGIAAVYLISAYSADNVSWSGPLVYSPPPRTAPYTYSFPALQGQGYYRLWTEAVNAAGTFEPDKPVASQLQLGFDATPPVSALTGPTGYWQRSGPLSFTATATDTLSGVAQIQLVASYSADNVTWSSPSVVATDATAPYAFSLTPTQGDGYYRFWAQATDAAENVEALIGKPTSGDVALALDRVAPSVVSSSPTSGATAVNVTGTKIRVTFSEAVDHAKALAAFSISPSVQGSFYWSGNTLTFTPSAALANGTTYTVSLATSVTDVAGNPLAAAYTFSFTTVVPSTPPPQTLDWVLPMGIAALVIVVAVVLVSWWVARRKKP